MDRRQRFPQPKSEYKDKIIDLRRVTRVVAGGKRLSFRATFVLGNEKGRVGIGVGKGLDVARAVEKAKTQAKKKLYLINLKGRTVPHETEAKSGAAFVKIKPATIGRGLKAGGAAREVLLLAGVKDATAKIIGTTKNKLTNAMATLEALKQLKEKPKKFDKNIEKDNS